MKQERGVGQGKVRQARQWARQERATPQVHIIVTITVRTPTLCNPD